MLENVIHAGAESTLAWLTAKDAGLKQLIDKSYGYAVFPAVTVGREPCLPLGEGTARYSNTASPSGSRP